MKPRVLLGFISYGPYHLARLKACRDLLTELNVEGWELSPVQSEYGWAHQKVTHLHAVTPSPLESVGRVQWSRLVWRHLNELNPDACVLAGYSHPGMLVALVWCLFHRRPVVVMSDSKEDDAPRTRWVEWCKGRVLSLYHSALVAGRLHRDYFIQLGYDAARIQTGYDVVDNAAYAKSPPQPAHLSRPYFLAVNRFIPKKNVSRIISAFAEYVKRCGRENAWDLVVCGDGPLRAELETQIASLGLVDKVLLPGFLQMQEMLPYYAHAEVFIHASLQEQWGLVVNEAMAAGLPVLVSNKCGCFPDLVSPGVTGFGFDPLDASEMTDLLLKCHDMSPIQRRAMGEKGRTKINAEHGLNHFAESLRACLSDAFPPSPR